LGQGSIRNDLFPPIRTIVMNAASSVGAGPNTVGGSAKSLALIGLCAAILLIGLTSNTVADTPYGLTIIFFWTQDLPILLAVAAMWAALLISPALRSRLWRAFTALARLRPWFALGMRAPLACAFIIAGACFAIGLAGSFLSLAAYPLSMDEFMANFDAEIFRHGQPMALVPPSWRSFAPALQPMFRLPTPGNTYWVSSYLPMNALFRAAIGSRAAAHLINPLWAATAVVAIFGVARKLWPQRPEIGLAAALMLATSSQFLVTAMTSYSMTGHLALNLVWLWLFLKGGKWGHGGAIVVAFAACGLHQLVFHPLFAAPFVVHLWLERRWKAATFYTASYAAICLFWIFYWTLALDWLGVAQAARSPAGAGAFASQALALVGALDPGAPSLMAKNLIRFVTWQNPLVLPLAVVGGGAAMAAKGALRSLPLGIVLAVVAIGFILPYQGYGWGFRYLHGFLGSACLLAAFGWARLVEGRSEAARDGAWAGFLLVTAGALAILIPIRLWQVARWARPYAEASAAIARDPAQVVMVDDSSILFGRQLVRNDPYLRNRPLVFSLPMLDAARARELCARYTVSVFDRASAARFGIVTFAPGDGASESSRKLPAGSRCGGQPAR
jgi:hypothetical protein